MAENWLEYDRKISQPGIYVAVFLKNVNSFIQWFSFDVTINAQNKYTLNKKPRKSLSGPEV